MTYYAALTKTSTPCIQHSYLRLMSFWLALPILCALCRRIRSEKLGRGGVRLVVFQSIDDVAQSVVLEGFEVGTKIRVVSAIGASYHRDNAA